MPYIMTLKTLTFWRFKDMINGCNSMILKKRSDFQIGSVKAISKTYYVVFNAKSLKNNNIVTILLGYDTILSDITSYICVLSVMHIYTVLPQISHL